MSLAWWRCSRGRVACTSASQRARSQRAVLFGLFGRSPCCDLFGLNGRVLFVATFTFYLAPSSPPPRSPHAHTRQMLKGGVAVDVVNVHQASGASHVFFLHGYLSLLPRKIPTVLAHRCST